MHLSDVWSNCSGEENLMVREAVEKLKPYLADENGMWGTCEYSLDNVTMRIQIIKMLCGLDDPTPESSSSETPPVVVPSSSSKAEVVITDPVHLCIIDMMKDGSNYIMPIWRTCSGDNKAGSRESLIGIIFLILILSMAVATQMM